ncbi:MAG: sulfotransferase domain-containing protein [Roseomonas sp.]|nr:sulfotransferase domain-containing protein [Roseomonas sp.]MBX9698633.1 sulfotransferase domain-containing protein [Acetobacteraceae bacterium]
MLQPAKPRVVHIHIPKTAGTALRLAFEKKFQPAGLKVAPHLTEENAQAHMPEDYAFFSGHIGYPTAQRIGGRILTVLRNPVDRIVSTYYFWRELYAKGIERAVKNRLAAQYSLEQFLSITDEPQLFEEFANRMTWQLTHGSSLGQRRAAREAGVTDDALLAAAMANLDSFAVVGIQENMGQFLADLKATFDVDLPLERANVTEERADLAELPASVFRAAYEWAYLDIQLYMYACGPYQAQAKARAEKAAAEDPFASIPI